MKGGNNMSLFTIFILVLLLGLGLVATGLVLNFSMKNSISMNILGIVILYLGTFASNVGFWGLVVVSVIEIWKHLI